MKRLHPLREDDLLIADPGLWIATGADSTDSVVLGAKPSRYFRLSAAATELLAYLATSPSGQTVSACRQRFPNLALESLARAGLVSHLPVHGLPVPPGLVRQAWGRNIQARLQLRRHGWDAIRAAMTPTSQQGMAPTARPLAFDELEAAARHSFALPATSRQCTVVALALDSWLRELGFASKVTVVVSTGQTAMHTYAQVGVHVIDPGDTLVEATELVPFPTTATP